MICSHLLYRFVDFTLIDEVIARVIFPLSNLGSHMLEIPMSVPEQDIDFFLSLDTLRDSIFTDISDDYFRHDLYLPFFFFFLKFDMSLIELDKRYQTELHVYYTNRVKRKNRCRARAK